MVQLNQISDEAHEEATKVLLGDYPNLTRDEVEAFSHFFSYMLLQTDKNHHKGGRHNWTNVVSVSKLLGMLRLSVQELQLAVEYREEDPENFRDKAADVANYAFYIWDQIEGTGLVNPGSRE